MENASESLNDFPSRFGPFQVHGLLGTGGSSSVFRATDARGTTVALKVLDAASSGTPSERNRFLRGFRVASTLDHPGIARLLDGGEIAGRLFVVEEFVDGDTLAERLQSGPLPIEESLRILRKAAEALAYAHQAGVVHRDLSPRNLMLERSGRIVLVDFGIAVRPEGTTQPGTNTLIGTLLYLAPELIRGRPASARSDLYALGAVAYQMFTGSPPFVATQPEALIQLHLSGRPASMRKSNRAIDPRLDRVVLRLLAKRPEDRFNNVDDFLAALDEATQPRQRGRALASPRRRAPVTSALAIRRLAIAGFSAEVDDSTDPDRARRVARGLAETVAAGLSVVEGLTVIPPRPGRWGEDESTLGFAEVVQADAVLKAHLVERGEGRRVAWTLVDRDGVILEGGRIGGDGDSLFAMEDGLLAAVIRALRRPAGTGRVASAGAHEGWYRSYLEALGCLQRADHRSAIDRAIALLEEIRDHNAGGARVHAALGRAHLRRAEMTRDPEDRKRAEADCRVAISLDPMAPEALVTMGTLLVARGRVDEAMDFLQRALAIAPHDPDALRWLSRAEEMRGDLDAADRLARRARDERPDLWQLHDRVAILDYRRGRFEDAEAGWRRVLELDANNIAAHTSLGAVLFEQGRLEEAEEEYRRAVDIEPSPAAVSGLGTVLFHQQQVGEAVRWLRDAVDRAPEDSRVWGNLADAQRWTPSERSCSMDSFDRAITLARRDLAENPADSRTWAELATYLAKREQHVEAHVAIDRAFATGAAPKEVRARAVVIHELAGRRDLALHLLRAIAEESSIPFEILSDPELSELRKDPSCRALLEKHPPAGSPRGKSPEGEPDHASVRGADPPAL